MPTKRHVPFEGIEWTWQVFRLPRRTWLRQPYDHPPYVEAMLDEYSMSSCYKHAPCWYPGIFTSYRTAQLGATKTIVYAVGRLQKKNTSPTTTDMAAGKDLLSPPVSERDGVCLGTRPHKGCDLYTWLLTTRNQSFITSGAPVGGIE